MATFVLIIRNNFFLLNRFYGLSGYINYQEKLQRFMVKRLS